MPDWPDVIYQYDGSFEGLMCCVFESYERNEVPVDIVGPGEHQVSLFAHREVETDSLKAARVLRSIPQKICEDALLFISRAFLTCMPQKEKHILFFLRKGFTCGRRVMCMIQDDAVNPLFKAVQHLSNEVHLLSGFIRFSIHTEAMVAEITPKNYVLPLIAPHFASRYPGEDFLIHDKTHAMVLTHECGNMRICDVEQFTMPAPDAEELRFRQLWKMFYDTIAIEGRYNPKCRMSHMPKRYWENMTEFAQGNRREKAAVLSLPVRV